jgi:hypothetical protein
MSAISETYDSLINNFNFIDGLQVIRKYATEYFTIDVVEVSVICVHGCSSFSEDDSKELTKMGWDAWTKQDKSGAEYRKLNYVDY